VRWYPQITSESWQQHSLSLFRLLAFAMDDGTVKLWELRAWEGMYMIAFSCIYCNSSSQIGKIIACCHVKTIIGSESLNTSLKTNWPPLFCSMFIKFNYFSPCLICHSKHEGTICVCIYVCICSQLYMILY
jgi:hypothetical protein